MATATADALPATEPRSAPPGMRLRVLPPVRPLTRADCINGPRPCPWTRCRHSLLAERGWRPGRRSCSLDVADAGGVTLGEIGELLGVSRERVRQIEKRAIENLAKAMRLRGLLSSREAWRVPAAVREALSP